MRNSTDDGKSDFSSRSPGSPERLRWQYERFPYPPIPWVALPARGAGSSLRLERGPELAGESAAGRISHEGRRILVAGCGTLEPLVVASNHPRASEIVAVDFSERSCAKARARLRLSRLARPLRGLPPVRIVHGDLAEWEDGRFDYIIASNLLHHTVDPAAMLVRMSAWLVPDGWMRVVTYPKGSRLWMRATSRYLKARGLAAATPDLVRRARALIRELPVGDPIRSCYESQPETETAAGLIDAFFNELENPLAPLEWESAARRAGLELAAEDQDAASQSAFLLDLLPVTRSLTRWERLQVLDDLLEVCANPVFWFRKVTPPPLGPAVAFEPALPEPRHELAVQLRRAERILAKAGTSLTEAIEALRREVGPRVSAPPDHRPLPGLSVTEYDLKDLLNPEPT